MIASLLALTGGYLDAYTWIVHRVFANAQTANLVLLWVYLAALRTRRVHRQRLTAA